MKETFRHENFAHIESMTPEEYKNGGKNLLINYSFVESPFGKIIVASTPKGICYLAFVDEEVEALNDLRVKFPNATYRRISDQLQQNALFMFTPNWITPEKINLHLKGTDFQLKVWATLLKIPLGQLTTYGDIAKQIDRPKASRAVGTAIGSNPVSLLIPCHRVIRASGGLGGYHWGLTRKTAIIEWERLINNPE